MFSGGSVTSDPNLGVRCLTITVRGRGLGLPVVKVPTLPIRGKRLALSLRRRPGDSSKGQAGDINKRMVVMVPERFGGR
jgi:hypothetical protein